jgi:hypothetical protein
MQFQPEHGTREPTADDGDGVGAFRQGTWRHNGRRKERTSFLKKRSKKLLSIAIIA